MNDHRRVLAALRPTKRTGALSRHALAATTIALVATLLPGKTSQAVFYTPCTTTLLAVQVSGEGLAIASSQSASQTVICLELGATEAVTGTLTITGVQAALPTVDGQSTACQNDPGYKRQFGAAILTTSFFIDTAMPSGDVEVCLGAGSLGARVLTLAQVGGVPQVVFTPATTPLGFAEPPWPTTGPSSSCDYEPFGTYPDVYVTSPSGSLWLGIRPLNNDSVCVRYQGAVTVGGVLTSPLTVPGPGCTMNVFSVTDPFTISLTGTQPGAWPFSLCLTGSLIGALDLAVTNPTTYAGSAWTPDPDSMI